MQTGHVVGSVHLSFKNCALFKALKPSPNGKQLIPVQTSSDIAVLSLPSLTPAYTIPSTFSHEGATGQADWVGWTSLSQPILVGRTANALLVSVHSAHDGALLVTYTIASGCFDRLRDKNVAASPHHPFLAMTYRQDPQKAYQRLTPRLLGALHYDVVLEGVEQEAAVEEAILQADIRYWTIVLDMSTGSVHFVAHARCLDPTNWRPSLGWAPDGLTVACSGGDYDNLNVWHGPSASVIGTFKALNVNNVLWSPRGKFCALMLGNSISAMLHLDSANGVVAVSEMCLDSYKASLPDSIFLERKECFDFSPCSRRLLYWGKLSRDPASSVRMLQWSIDPVQGIFPPEEVMNRYPPVELEPTGCTWLSSLPAACLYMVTLRSGLVHLMSGLERPQADPLVTLNIKQAWPSCHQTSFFRNYIVSPDGLILLCCNAVQSEIAIFRFDA